MISNVGVVVQTRSVLISRLLIPIFSKGFESIYMYVCIFECEYFDVYLYTICPHNFIFIFPLMILNVGVLVQTRSVLISRLLIPIF